METQIGIVPSAAGLQGRKRIRDAAKRQRIRQQHESNFKILGLRQDPAQPSRELPNLPKRVGLRELRSDGAGIGEG
jgi:hypothetical protein